MLRTSPFSDRPDVPHDGDFDDELVAPLESRELRNGWREAGHVECLVSECHVVVCRRVAKDRPEGRKVLPA